MAILREAYAPIYNENDAADVGSDIHEDESAGASLNDKARLRLRSNTALTSPVLALVLAACGGGGSSDGGGGATTSGGNTVTLNQPPSFGAATGIADPIAENTLDLSTWAYVAPEATDADGGNPSYTLDGLYGDLFEFNANTRTVTFRSGTSLDFETTPIISFTIVATDTAGAEATHSVSVRVTNVDEAPRFSNPTKTSTVLEETGLLAFTSEAINPDNNDQLTYTLTGADAAWFGVDSQTGAVRFKKTSNYEAFVKHRFDLTVTAADGAGNSAKQDVTLTLANVNEAPIFAANRVSAVIKTTEATIFTISTHDPDGDTPTYVLSEEVTDMLEVDQSTGAVTVKTGAAPKGADESYIFMITANDGKGGTETQIVTVLVSDTDFGFDASAVVITKAENIAASDSATEKGSAELVHTASTTDSGARYSLKGDGATDDAELFGIDDSTGEVWFRKSPNFEEQEVYRFTIVATDTNDAEIEQAVIVYVTNSREKPVFTSGATPSVAENMVDTGYTAQAMVDDLGETVSYSLKANESDDAALFTIDAKAGVVVFNTAPDFETKSEYKFTVVAKADIGGAEQEQAVTLTLTDVNEAPSITSTAPTTVDENVAIVYTPTVADPDASDTKAYAFDDTATDDHALFDIDASTGAVSFKNSTLARDHADYTAPPDFETATKKSFTFTIIVTDGGSLTDSQTVTIELQDANEAPTFVKGDGTDFGATDGASIDENSSSAEIAAWSYIAPSARDDDPDDTLVYTLEGADKDSFDFDAGTRTVTFKNTVTALDHETKATYDLTIKATDANADDDAHSALYDEIALTVSVNDINEAPVFGTDSATATADENATAVTYALNATDVDANDSITYSLKETGDHNLFSITNAGVLTFKTAPDFESPPSSKTSYSLTVIATDKAGLSDEQTVTVTLRNVNEAPVFGADGAGLTIDENSPTSTTVYTAPSVTDPDANETKAYSVVGTDRTYFDVSTTGVVTFKAKPNYETQSSYKFMVRVTDSGGATDTTGEITVTLNDVNEAPVFAADGAGLTIAENSATSTTVYTAPTVTDPDANETKAYSVIGTDRAYFNISNTGVVTFKAKPNYETQSSYKFMVRVTDKGGASDTTGEITVTLTDVDEAPSFTSGATMNATENSTTVGSVTATDPEAAAVTYRVAVATDATGSNALVSSLEQTSLFNISTSGVVTFKIKPNFEGPNFSGITANDDGKKEVKFVVIATDATSNETAQTVTVALANVDEAPTIAAGTVEASLAENVSDVTSAAVYTLGTVDDPDAGDDIVTYTLYDSDDGTDGDSSKFQITSGKVYFKSGTSLDYEMKSSYTFKIRVTDTDNAALYNETADITINITNVNEAPVFGNDSATATANENTTAVGYTPNASDVDSGDAITYSLKATGDHSLFSMTNAGVLTFKTAPNFESPPSNKTTYSLTVIATDKAGATDEQTVTVTLRNVNEAPVFGSDSATATADENTTATTYSPNATDVDSGDAITYSLKSTGDHSLFNMTDAGVLTFKTAPNFESPPSSKTSYSLTVIATDKAGLTDEQTVTVTLRNVNEAPVFGSDSATATADENATATTYTPNATDVDSGDAITYSLKSTGDHSLFNMTDAGVLTFKTAPNFESPPSNKTTYSLTVIATDKAGLTDEQTVTVTLRNVNEAPVFGSDSATAMADENATATTYTPDATDVDSGDAITYSLKETGDHSLFSMTDAGVLTFKTAPNFESPPSNKTTYSLTVIATDKAGLTDEQTVTVTLRNVNETPVFSSVAPTSLNENTTTVYTAIASDEDSADSVTYSLKGNGTNDDAEFFSIVTSGNDAGKVTFKTAGNDIANRDFEGSGQKSYSFTVIATGGTGGRAKTEEQAVSFTLANVNEAPKFSSVAPTTLNENLTTVYTASASDEDSADSVTYSLKGNGTNDDAEYFSVDSSSGVVTFNTSGSDIANRDFEGSGQKSYSFTVIATGGTGGRAMTEEQAVSFSLANVDDNAPVLAAGTTTSVNENVAANDSATVKGSAFIIYNASTGVTDADGSGFSHTYSLAMGDKTTYGIDSSTGEVWFRASPDFETPPTDLDFTVTVTDSGGNSDSKTVTVSITNLDDNAPVLAAGTTTSVNENVAANDSATVKGSAFIIYNASTGLTDADGSGFSHTYSLATGDKTTYGIDSSTGEVWFRASPDFETPPTDLDFTVTVTDSNTDVAKNSDSKTVTVSIVNVNEAPVFTSNAATDSVSTTATKDTVIYTIPANAATDVDGDTLTYSLASKSGGSDLSLVTFNATNRTITLNANNAKAADEKYEFVITASDGTLSTTQALTLTVSDTAPSFGNDIAKTVSVAENIGTGTVHTAVATDPDGSDLTYSLKDALDKASFDITSGGVVTFKSTTNVDYDSAKKQYKIVILASDGTDTAEQTLTVNLTDINEAPSFATDSATATANENATATTYNPNATDPDSDTLTYSLKATGDYSLFNINNAGVLTFKAAPNYESPPSNKTSYSLTVIASDGNSGTANTEQTVTVTLRNVNEAPSFGSDSATATADENATATTYTPNATDVDSGDEITYSLKSTGDHNLFNMTNAGVLTFKTAPNFESPPSNKTTYSLTVIATDKAGATDEQTVTVTLRNVNETPVFGSDSATATADENATATTYSPNATDVDSGDAITYSLKETGDHSLFNMTDAGVLTFKTAPNFESPPSNKTTYSLTVIATDKAGATDEQTVTVTLRNVNEGKAAFAVTGSGDGALNAAKTADDPDGNGTFTYTWQKSSTGNSGWADISGATSASYTPKSSDGYVRLHQITYTDGAGRSETVTLTDSLFKVYIGTSSNDGPIFGGSGRNYMNGGAGADYLWGSSGYDILYGGAGNDWLDGDDGDDSLYGGAGNDVLDGDDGDDSLYGGAGADYLYGNYGDDSLYSGAGADYLWGSSGDDIFVLELTATAKDAVSDFTRNDDKIRVDVNSTSKTAIETASGDAAKLTALKNATGIAWTNNTKETTNGSYGGITTATNDANTNDTVIFLDTNGNGTRQSNEAIVMVLEDYTTALTIADFEIALAPNLTLTGTTGNDTLVGNAGTDTLTGGAGNDTLYGGAGTDTLTGGAGNDTLYGGAGADTLTGNAGNDDFVLELRSGYRAKDRVTDFASGDQIRYIPSDTQLATILAGADDTAKLNSLKTQLKLRWTNTTSSDGSVAGNDTVIYWTNGTSTTSDDVKVMVLENYTTTLTIADFELNGTALFSVTGSSDGALVAVKTVDDPDGNGTFTYTWQKSTDGYSGWTAISGATTASYTPASGDGYVRLQVNYTDGAGTTETVNNDVFKVYIGTSGNDGTLSNRITGGSGRDYMDGGAGNDSLDGSSGDDSLYGGTGNDWLTGNDGDDSLYGGAGNDYLSGRTGDDSLYGGAGADYFYGWTGDDIFVLELTATAKDAVRDFNGYNTDKIRIDVSSAHKTTIDNASGNTAKLTALKTATGIAWTNNTKETTNGSYGGLTTGTNSSSINDTVIFLDTNGNGTRDNNEAIVMVLENYTTALTFADFDIALAPNLTLTGTTGNDTLYGGAGTDTLTGGPGNDDFVLELRSGYRAKDRVTDFTSGDQIRYIPSDTQLASITNLATLKSTLKLRWTNTTSSDGSVAGNDTVIYWTNGTSTASDDVKVMVLENYTTALTFADFELNGVAAFAVTGSSDGALVAEKTADDPDGNGTFAYQWQKTSDTISNTETVDDLTGWTAISGATSASYTPKSGDGYVRLQITYTDGAGTTETVNNDVFKVYVGTSGNDGTHSNRITGGSGRDYMDGGAGNDSLDGSSGDDSLYGGTGNDFLRGYYGDDSLYGGAGNDRLNGHGDDDSLYGGVGTDYLWGDTGDDIFYGGAGNDYLRGGYGDDIFVLELTATAKDAVRDFNQKWDSVTRIDIFDSTRPDKIRVEVNSTHKTAIENASGNTAKLTALKNATGIAWTNNTKESTNGSYGGGWSTTYNDANTNDTVIFLDTNGNGTRDNNEAIVMVLEDYTTTLTINDFSIHAYETALFDMTGSSDGALVAVKTANDPEGNGTFAYHWQKSSNGNSGWADISGATGNASYTPKSSDGYVRLHQITYTDGAGNSETVAPSNNDVFKVYVGTSSNNGTHSSNIEGGSGRDYMNGGGGHDSLEGAWGNDIIYGGTGNDYLSGGSHDDIIYGGVGTDYLNGWLHDDILSGGAGADHLVGFTGDDIFVLELTATAKDTVRDFTRNYDKIRVDVNSTHKTAIEIASGNTAKLTALKNATGIAWTNNTKETTNGTYGGSTTTSNDANTNDTVIFLDTNGNGIKNTNEAIVMVLEDYTTALTINDFTIHAYDTAFFNVISRENGALMAVKTSDDPDGNGTFTYHWQKSSNGNSGWADISGATGNASYTPKSSDGYVRLHQITYTDGAGNSEAVTVSDEVFKVYIGTSGNNGTSFNTRIQGGSGHDYMNGGAGNDYLSGNNDDDILYGGTGNDRLDGWYGDDSLYGGAGRDLLDGNDEDDILYGGAGADYLWGYWGFDLFVLELRSGYRAKDTVGDFTRNYDKIRVDVSSTHKTTIDNASGNTAKLTALKAAAGIAWTNNTKESTNGSYGTHNTMTTNDANTNDTVIFLDTNGNGTRQSNEAIVMVLEDYTTALTIADFDIV